jgi:hypothetical protein
MESNPSLAIGNPMQGDHLVFSDCSDPCLHLSRVTRVDRFFRFL